MGIWERGDFEPQRHKGHKVWGTTKAQRSQRGIYHKGHEGGFTTKARRGILNHKGTKNTKGDLPQRHKGHKEKDSCSGEGL